MKIEIKSRFGGVLFTYEKENATIKDAVLQALKENAYLSGAYLRAADLSGADLSGADLSDAYLRGADLSDAYLRGANLSDAYLINADLRAAYLSGADLSGADLINANLINADLSNVIKMPIFCKWTHGITNGNLIHIGCEKRTIEDWDAFFASDEIISTPRNTPEFKQIEAVYNAYKAYLKTLNK
ncbi:MAG: hypothetical protein RL737_272 [Bacteroidota bacterium]|jgi:hypothetical protein